MSASSSPFDEIRRVVGGSKEALTCTDAFNRNSLGALCAGRQRFLRWVQGGVEKGVNERGFAEAGLAWARGHAMSARVQA